jgi:hypothetical protein
MKTAGTKFRPFLFGLWRCGVIIACRNEVVDAGFRRRDE